MSALDHFLNGLDAVLKHSDRAAAEKAAARAAKAKSKAGFESRVVSKPAPQAHAFGGDAAPKPVDPLCCLAKRRVK